jgi:predicted permease
MRRAPGFAAAVVLTFALGIGANAVMFGIVDRLLLRPPAYIAHPEQVRRLAGEFTRSSGEQNTNDRGSYADFENFSGAHSFSGVAGYWNRDVTLGRGEAARKAKASFVTGSFFSTLGVAPLAGRFFGPNDDRPGAPGTVVISYRFWQREFGGRSDVVGRVLDVGADAPFTIVGVTPRGFTGVELEPQDLWLPIRATTYAMGDEHWVESPGNVFLRRVVRIAPGVSDRQAEAEATVLYRQAHREDLERFGDVKVRMVAAPIIAGAGPLARKEASVARWLAAVSLLVLLIACANIANLLLARSARQRGETAVRLALGSSRARVIGQGVTEAVLLALLGGVAALAVAWWGGELLGKLLLPEIVWEYPGARVRLAVVVLSLTILAALFAGLVPAWQSTRPGVMDALKSGARNVSSPGSRIRSSLTVVQAMLSVVLLVGSGLFVLSLRRVRAENLGIDWRGAYLVTPNFEQGVSDADREEFYRRATARLRAIPGVEHASYSVGVPFSNSRGMSLHVPGLDSIPSAAGGSFYHAVEPDYFAALGLRILQGRAFTTADREGAPNVMLVSERMARFLWPGQNPLGKCARLGSAPMCVEVIGVVEDARRFNIVEEPSMELYLPIAQSLFSSTPDALIVRSPADDTGLAASIQRALLQTESRLRFARVQPLQEIIDPQAHTWRLGAVVFSAFGLLSLLVAAVGLYSLLAFAVAQRTFELGVRTALGASRSRLMGLVFREAIRLVVLGVVLGLVAALLAGPKVEPLLFHTSPRDPTILGIVAVVLLLVGAVAALLPALRATRVDPSIALRSE